MSSIWNCDWEVIKCGDSKVVVIRIEYISFIQKSMLKTVTFRYFITVLYYSKCIYRVLISVSRNTLSKKTLHQLNIDRFKKKELSDLHFQYEFGINYPWFSNKQFLTLFLYFLKGFLILYGFVKWNSIHILQIECFCYKVDCKKNLLQNWTMDVCVCGFEWDRTSGCLKRKSWTVEQ